MPVAVLWEPLADGISKSCVLHCRRNAGYVMADAFVQLVSVRATAACCRGTCANEPANQTIMRSRGSDIRLRYSNSNDDVQYRIQYVS